MNNSDAPTILLIEDNKADIGLFKESINHLRLNLNLYVISNGSYVMDFINRKGIYEGINSPDLIILDINLPGLNGFEILNQIRKIDSFKNLPIAILTTSTQIEDLIEALELGADSLFVKPSDFLEFTSTVKSILHQYLANKVKFS